MNNEKMTPSNENVPEAPKGMDCGPDTQHDLAYPAYLSGGRVELPLAGAGEIIELITITLDPKKFNYKSRPSVNHKKAMTLLYDILHDHCFEFHFIMELTTRNVPHYHGYVIVKNKSVSKILQTKLNEDIGTPEFELEADKGGWIPYMTKDIIVSNAVINQTMKNKEIVDKKVQIPIYLKGYVRRPTAKIYAEYRAKHATKTMLDNTYIRLVSSSSKLLDYINQAERNDPKDYSSIGESNKQYLYPEFNEIL